MAEGSVSETLDRSPPSQSWATPLSPSSSSSPSSSPTAVDPSLSRSASFSGLNAKAPEFVPSPRPQPQQQQQRIAIPPPPPPGVVHVYPPYHGHPLVPFRHYPSQVPVWFHQQQPPQQQQHGQYHSTGADQEASLSKGGDHHQQSHNNQNQNYHHHHRRRQQVQGDQDQAASSNGMSDETVQKVLNQVEYYFSDVNLATTDHLMRFISKDPEGYGNTSVCYVMEAKLFDLIVPISVVASFKKIKSFVNSSTQLSSILRNSSKLVVSEDGKKVKRLHPLTDSEMEEFQSRVVIAENLPEDHCYQNLMKIFSAVGSVKAIRTCQPQSAGGGPSPGNRLGKANGMLYCNKLHAFVEYESVDVAEKAVEELNDEENWRSGLRVRLILRRGGKPVQARGTKGHDGEQVGEEEDASTSEHQPNSRQQLDESPELSDGQMQGNMGDESVNDREGGQKKGRDRGRGKGRGRGQYHQNYRGSHPGMPTVSNPIANEPSLLSKQPPGPRMPDATRGFSMGRGKPVSVDTT